MCEPMTIAAATMAVAAAGSAYTGYQGAKVNAQIQNHIQEQNEINSLASMQQSYVTTQQRQAQEMEAASEAIQNRRLEATKQLATATVASGESGVSGFSVERVLRDMLSMGSRDVTTIEQNRDWNVTQLDNQLNGIRTQAINNINSVTGGVSPSAWPYAFQAAGGMANAYGTYKTGQ